MRRVAALVMRWVPHAVAVRKELVFSQLGRLDHSCIIGKAKASGISSILGLALKSNRCAMYHSFLY